MITQDRPHPMSGIATLAHDVFATNIQIDKIALRVLQ